AHGILHLEIVVPARFDKIARGSTGFAAGQAPRRALTAAGVRRAPAAVDQAGHLGDDAETAAKFAGAAGIIAQRTRIDDHRGFELDGFDRRVAHVALTDRHGSGFAIFPWTGAPAAAFDGLQDEVALLVRIVAEEGHGAAERAEMGCRRA